MKSLPILIGLGLAAIPIVAAPAQTRERTGHAPSADDYPSIQEAIRANPGRMVYVSAGDYDISEKIHIGRQGGGLFGPGRIRQSNPGQPILVVEGATGVQIRHLTLMRPEGKTDTQSEGVLAIGCRDLVLEDLQVVDNRTRTAAIELRDCYASQVRYCLVRNYQCISVDDRTMDEDSGYAFKCLIGTGITLRDCRATLVQGNRVIEQHLFPTPDVKKTFHLGDYTKKNRAKGRFAKQEDWDREYTKIARIANDFIADIVRQHPDRFLGLCVLPLQDMPAALGELDRCVHRLGMRGILLYTNLVGRFPDEPQFRPLFARAVDLDVPILLHPALPVTAPLLKDYEMISGLGNMFEDTMALARIILSGILDEYPRLKLVSPHLGGTLPFIIGRLDHQHPSAETRPAESEEGPQRLFASGLLRHRLPTSPGNALGLRSGRPRSSGAGQRSSLGRSETDPRLLAKPGLAAAG